MNSRESIKIAVAETSIILRSGVVAALKRSASENIQFIEFDSPENFVRQIRPYSPNILIINPLFGGQFSITKCRTDKELGLMDTKIVALQTSILDSTIIENYDAVINLYDTEDQLRDTIDQMIFGPEESEEEVNPDEAQLSSREKEIICELVKGKTNKEIATALNLSVFTVQTHRRNISRKLQIHSSTALAIYAISNKLVSIADVK